MERTRSIAGVFIVGPTLTGVRHGEFMLFRVDTQMSSLSPTEPVRLDVKYSVFSSFDRTAAWSSNLELIGGGRCCAAVQSEKAGPCRTCESAPKVNDTMEMKVIRKDFESMETTSKPFAGSPMTFGITCFGRTFLGGLPGEIVISRQATL